jgi:hypothetical protein
MCVQLFLVPDLEGNAEGLYEGPAIPWQFLWGFSQILVWPTC